jgi:hypothetical protein
MVCAGLASSAWGALAALVPYPVDPPAALWLAAYALLFGAVLLGLAGRLMRRHRDDAAVDLDGARPDVGQGRGRPPSLNCDHG